MTICTIDVHARDVVAKMIMAKARDFAGGAGNLVRGRQPPAVPLPRGWEDSLAAPSPHPCSGGGPEGREHPWRSGMGLVTSGL